MSSESVIFHEECRRQRHDRKAIKMHQSEVTEGHNDGGGETCPPVWIHTESFITEPDRDRLHLTPSDRISRLTPLSCVCGQPLKRSKMYRFVREVNLTLKEKQRVPNFQRLSEHQENDVMSHVFKNKSNSTDEAAARRSRHKTTPTSVN